MRERQGVNDMLSFASDYTTGAHPAILKRLGDTNFEALGGYGTDKYCASAAEKIKAAFGCPEGEVFFLVGGTQTNQVIISTMLASHEGVISADTGHVNVHEAGAIEYTGHKVIGLGGKDGKLSAKAVEDYVKRFYGDASYEHMVFPGMVYVSFPTEYGTLYSKKELEDIYGVCKRYGMVFYIDGARLGYGLEGFSNDVKPCDLHALCDVFYVGGTKVGALCGEAVVFTHGNAPKHFITQVKQRGAMLAKGRLLGIQFDVLFTDGLYFEISRHAIEMSEKLKNVLKRKGCMFFLETPTNQQFVVMEDSKLEELSKHVSFGWWEKYDESRTVVRFATSWSTTEGDLAELEKYL